MARKRRSWHAARPQPQREDHIVTISASHITIWCIVALATAGVILRPFRLPEAVWAVTGAVLLVVTTLLPLSGAWTGIVKGLDVYLFLVGMMLLAETAREVGLFDWLAAVATRYAKGSPKRLFLLIYAVGTVVTVFLSNDAAAVVLTPAVAAAVKAAKVKSPLPYLFICAFIANAASFVLPISNPANLVIYNNHVPPLLQWLPRYLLPSLFSIVATFIVLRWTQRKELRQGSEVEVEIPHLSGAGKVAGFGIVATAVVLLISSFKDIQLGLPTLIAGGLTAIVVLISQRKAPWGTLKGVSWSVLPLVAGLFVMVEALDSTGLIKTLGLFLQSEAQRSAVATAWGAGGLTAVACNLMNNLPAGLVVGSAVQTAHVSDTVTRAILIGVDLGPNLSITGSLATLLWLVALRREGIDVSAWQFLKLGALVMPPALLLATGAMFLLR